MLFAAAALLATCGAVLLLRVFWVLFLAAGPVAFAQRFPRRVPAARRPKARRVLVVLGSGGHTAEMLSFMDAVPSAEWTPRRVAYVVSDTDVHSADIAAAMEMRRFGRHALVRRIPRAREVGQSYGSSVFTTLRALAACFSLVWAERPDAILTNGPGVCVPVVAAALLLRAAGLLAERPAVAYFESLTCVEHLSLSGRILFRAADVFAVQWPQLARRLRAGGLPGRHSGSHNSFHLPARRRSGASGGSWTEAQRRGGGAAERAAAEALAARVVQYTGPFIDDDDDDGDGPARRAISGGRSPESMRGGASKAPGRRGGGSAGRLADDDAPGVVISTLPALPAGAQLAKAAMAHGASVSTELPPAAADCGALLPVAADGGGAPRGSGPAAAAGFLGVRMSPHLAHSTSSRRDESPAAEVDSPPPCPTPQAAAPVPSPGTSPTQALLPTGGAGRYDGQCVVTVGSTEFDELIAACDAADFYLSVFALGVRRVLLQVGTTRDPRWAPPAAGAAAAASTEFRRREQQRAAQLPIGLTVAVARYVPELGATIRGAALVVSHAGAGTIREALGGGVPAVVVPNPRLMSNHQLELAAGLHRRRHLFCVELGAMPHALARLDWAQLRRFPEPQAAAIERAVRRVLG